MYLLVFLFSMIENKGENIIFFYYKLYWGFFFIGKYIEFFLFI